MIHTLMQTSIYSLIPSAPIVTYPQPSTTPPSSPHDPAFFFFSQQTPLHRGCARWASPVEANF